MRKRIAFISDESRSRHNNGLCIWMIPKTARPSGLIDGVITAGEFVKIVIDFARIRKLLVDKGQSGAEMGRRSSGNRRVLEMPAAKNRNLMTGKTRRGLLSIFIWLRQILRGIAASMQKKNVCY